MVAERLFLRIEAPFAVCRPFVAGWYRPTAAFLTHSAVYGVLLNVAGIESRLWEHEDDHDGRVPASLTRSGLPAMRIAIGLPEGVEPPRVQTVYQQLHNYPQDDSPMDDPENPGTEIRKLAEGFRRCKGNKFNITPIRREVLCDIRAVVAVQCDAHFAVVFQRGLAGKLSAPRYGLPFLGDNSFLIDRFYPVPLSPTRWYVRVQGGRRPLPGTTRLSSRVDRADMSRTQTALYAPLDVSIPEPPDGAWAEVGAA